MRRAVQVALICGCLLGVVSAAAAQNAKLPPTAEKAIEARDWKQVVKLLKPLAKDAAHEPANYWLGTAHFSLGQMSNAFAPLAAALKVNPRCRPTAVMLARCGAKLALSDTFRVSRIDPAAEAFPVDAEVAHWIGRAWMNRYFFKQWYRRPGDELKKEGAGYLRSAVQEFRRAAMLQKDYAENHRWTAFALMRTGQVAEALEHARKARELGPVGWETHMVTGNCLTRLGRAAEADVAYRGAGAACPALRKQVDFERGKALHQAGRYNEAVGALKDVLYAEKGYPFGRHWLGRSAVAAREYRLALWAVKESRMLDAGLIDDFYWAGRSAYGIEQYALAEKLISEAIGQAKSHGGLPGADWVHYLGRAQWGQGKRAEAFKNLETAFERRKWNLVYGRWLFQAYVAGDELYKAAMVCWWLGTNRQRGAAIEYLDALVAKWPRPRFADFIQKKYPHARAAYEILGNLHYQGGRYFTSSHYFRQGKNTQGRYARTRAGWAHLHIGRHADAEKIFRSYLEQKYIYQLRSATVVKHKQNEADKDYGRFGLGTTLALTKRWAEAHQAFKAITKKSWAYIRDPGLLWTGLALKKAEVRKLADPYTLLGLMQNRLWGRSRGVEVMAVLPGSLLDGHKPAIRVNDRVVRVGEMYLGSSEQMKAFRASKIPAGAVRALIRRGKREFEVTLDYSAAVARLAKLPEVRPAEKEGER